MAEGTGIEPVSPCGEPRRSKPVQCRSASLPRKNEECRREESNLQPLESESSASAELGYAGMQSDVVAVDGIEPPWPRRLVYSEPPIHTGLHRRTWCARSDSNRHRQAPRACASAVGLRARLVGQEGFEPTRSHVLSMVPLPLGYWPGECWRRAEDSNLHDRSRLFSRQGRCQFRYSPPQVRVKGATAITRGMSDNCDEKGRPRLESNQHPPAYGTGALPSSYGAGPLCCRPSWRLLVYPNRAGHRRPAVDAVRLSVHPPIVPFREKASS